MGAGRKTKEDQLDYSVGYILKVRIGDHVEKDTPLCELHARNEAEADEAERAIRQAIEIGFQPVGRAKLFFAEMTAEETTIF
jgi:thymidine phosphorylase